MFRWVQFKLFGQVMTVNTNTAFMLFSIFVVFLMFCVSLRRQVPVWKIALLIAVTSVNCFLGARIFHVILERPAYFAEHPGQIFSSFDGMVFYGALFFGALTFFPGLYSLVQSDSLRKKMLDLVAIGAGICYGFQRIGCFANGCCWGNLCSLPWAVTYTRRDAIMPLLGIPVHPVQLYDSFLGFSIMTVLIILMRKGYFRGKLLAVFCVLYAVGRFVTEDFRGDSSRGVNILWNLSTSQIISIPLLVAGLTWLFYGFSLRAEQSRFMGKA